ncbi:MAG: hypothetical protein QW057_10950 [Candidatus Bathyarchaeia archaeon]
MPQKILCDGCGYVFYYGEDLLVPEDLIRQNYNQCPKCGRRLDLENAKVIIGKRTTR